MTRALAPFRPILADPALRLAAALMLLYGALIATMAPYVSSLAVTVFGLRDGDYAAVLVLASLLSVSASVGLGIRADQRANRRRIAIGSIGLLLAGIALVLLGQSPAAFVLAHAVVLPLSATLFGQIFALSRLATSTQPLDRRDAIMAALRALFALPWVVMLPIWSVAFNLGTPLLAIYPVCLVLAALMLWLVLRHWPRDGATRWHDPKSGLSFTAALREMGRPEVLVRVLALGMVSGAVTLYIALIGLVFLATPERGAEAVALYVGFVAGLEVPFMLMLPRLMRVASRATLILAGAFLYASHLALMPVLATTPLVWLLILPAAAGGALVLTLPIAYLQDLLADRPGAGASLMALQKLAGDGVCAASFAFGTWLSGYALAGMIGAVLAVSGATAIWLMDRR